MSLWSEETKKLNSNYKQIWQIILNLESEMKMQKRKDDTNVTIHTKLPTLQNSDRNKIELKISAKGIENPRIKGEYNWI